MSDVNSIDRAGPGDRRRWLILGVIGLAQLMVVLDVTVMNIALPSAQRALQFTTADRQWVVTAYTLAFGSLLLLGGRLADLLGRKVTFLVGLLGFAGVSAIGGASVNFGMLITARACQGAFGALLVPSALSLLTTTFTEPKERGKAFGIYGAIAAAGGAIGLLLGGALTEYLSWRWTLYVNLIFAGVAFIGGVLLLERQRSQVKPRLDIPGVLLVSAALFCLVYGFSNAATHNWHTPSTWGFLAAGVVLLVLFAVWQTRARNPLLPPRIVLDRNRGGAYASMLLASSGMFGVFLFLTYYLQQTLAYSPVVTGFAILPIAARHRDRGQPVHDRADAEDRAEAASDRRVRGRRGRDDLVRPAGTAHRLRGRRARPAHPDRDRPRHGDRAVDQHRHLRRGPARRRRRLGHRHRRPATRCLDRHFAAQHHLRQRRRVLPDPARAPRPADRLIGRQALLGQALAHGYDTAFWWVAGIFAGGAIVGGLLFRRGPLRRDDGQVQQDAGVMAETEAGPVLPA